MSQSINSDKSVFCIKIENHSGSRNSKQILYNNTVNAYVLEHVRKMEENPLFATQ
jgi:hypothetical protein